jgi:membrane protease YdiL (CAAX protease family)
MYIMIFFGGLALSLVLLRTHRLRWCIFFHAMWNTGAVLLAIIIFSFLF